MAAYMPYNILLYVCSKTQLDQNRAAHMQSIVQEHRVYARILTNNQYYMAPIGTCSVSSLTHVHSLLGHSMPPELKWVGAYMQGTMKGPCHRVHLFTILAEEAVGFWRSWSNMHRGWQQGILLAHRYPELGLGMLHILRCSNAYRFYM